MAKNPVYGHLVGSRPDGSKYKLPITPSSLPALAEIAKIGTFNRVNAPLISKEQAYLENIAIIMKAQQKRRQKEFSGIYGKALEIVKKIRKRNAKASQNNVLLWAANELYEVHKISRHPLSLGRYISCLPGKEPFLKPKKPITDSLSAGSEAHFIGHPGNRRSGRRPDSAATRPARRIAHRGARILPSPTEE